MPTSLSAVVLGAAVALTLTACSGADDPAPVSAPPAVDTSATAFASPVASPAGPESDDPPGAIACRQLAEATSAATLMDPGVVDRIVQVASTADAPIADSAQRLVTAYQKAVNAGGTDQEPDAVAAVSAAGAEMAEVCADSGLETVG